MPRKSDKKQVTQETIAYARPISEKDKIIEKLKKEGFQCEISATGIPMFHVSSKKEVSNIRETIAGRFSFGYVGNI